MDFIHDSCVGGRRFRCLTMVDEYTRECPVIEFDASLPAARVIGALDQRSAPYQLGGTNPRRICQDLEGERPHHPTLSLTLELTPQRGEDQPRTDMVPFASH